VCEALVNLGIERVVGAAQIFINFDEEMLLQGVAALLPRGRSVVEILENVVATPELIAVVQSLRKSGIKIALDDFSFQEHAQPFLPYADYIKIDVLACAETLPVITERLRPYPNIGLVAEKVETHEQHRYCGNSGYRYFQGYYFVRPETLVQERIGSNKVAILQVLTELQNPDRSADQLAHVIGRDVRLAQQILRLANSAAYRRTRRVTSIAEATVVLGEDTMRRCVSLLLLAQLGDNKPPELMCLALARGQMCEQLARVEADVDEGSAFTAGLFSVLDALMDRPMGAIVSELNLPTSMAAPLLGDVTLPLGALLKCVIDYQRGDWDALGDMHERSASLARSYLQALQIADELVR
jgi:EAL and modified HD-GYP domain-containing signal transduction protein